MHNCELNKWDPNRSCTQPATVLGGVLNANDIPTFAGQLCEDHSSEIEVAVTDRDDGSHYVSEELGG